MTTKTYLPETTENEEDKLSFLPEAPIAHIKVPRRSKKKKLCSPCLLKVMVFLFTFSSVIGVKLLLLTHPPGSKSRSQAHVTKWNDLDLTDIQNWCLQPNVTSCKCANPLQPTHRHGHKTWTEAHRDNIQFAKNNIPKKSPFRELDVVFLGDSITEGWRGTSFGQKADKKQENVKVFEDLFDMDSGGEYDGLALGIAGDKNPNLLWRLQHGEMPRNLKSKVFWVLIGTNDFLRENHCSEEVVLMGIERVIEELLHMRPSSTIVVNGLLPRALDLDSPTVGNGSGQLYREGEKTVMDAIDIVNRHLEEFCSSRDDLEYFDATDLFVDEDRRLGKGRYSKFIPKELMDDHLHPTTLGYRKWGNKIVDELRRILDGQLTVE